MKRGFSIIETLIVIGILAVFASILFQSIGRFGEASVIDGDARTVHAILSEARSRTIASHNDQQYGVHFSSSAVTLFIGDSYDAGTTTNETTALSSRVSLATDLSGGVDDIVFSRITGEASAFGTTTVTLLSSTSPRTLSIVIYDSGVIEVVE